MTGETRKSSGGQKLGVMTVRCLKSRVGRCLKRRAERQQGDGAHPSLEPRRRHLEQPSRGLPDLPEEPPVTAEEVALRCPGGDVPGDGFLSHAIHRSYGTA